MGDEVFSSMPGADSKQQTDELAEIEKKLARLSGTFVSLDQDVTRLQTIGIKGEGGLSSGPSIHFEIREGKQPQNPLEWLRP